MSSGSVKKWVRKQIDKATESEKSKLAKVKELLMETEAILADNSDEADIDAALVDALTRVKLALAWIGK